MIADQEKNTIHPRSDLLPQPVIGAAESASADAIVTSEDAAEAAERKQREADIIKLVKIHQEMAANQCFDQVVALPRPITFESWTVIFQRDYTITTRKTTEIIGRLIQSGETGFLEFFVDNYRNILKKTLHNMYREEGGSELGLLMEVLVVDPRLLSKIENMLLENSTRFGADPALPEFIAKLSELDPEIVDLKKALLLKGVQVNYPDGVTYEDAERSAQNFAGMAIELAGQEGSENQEWILSNLSKISNGNDRFLNAFLTFLLNKSGAEAVKPVLLENDDSHIKRVVANLLAQSSELQFVLDHWDALSPVRTGYSGRADHYYEQIFDRIFEEGKVDWLKENFELVFTLLDTPFRDAILEKLIIAGEAVFVLGKLQAELDFVPPKTIDQYRWDDLTLDHIDEILDQAAFAPKMFFRGKSVSGAIKSLIENQQVDWVTQNWQQLGLFLDNPDLRPADEASVLLKLIDTEHATWVIENWRMILSRINGTSAKSMVIEALRETPEGKIRLGLKLLLGEKYPKRKIDKNIH